MAAWGRRNGPCIFVVSEAIGLAVDENRRARNGPLVHELGEQILDSAVGIPVGLRAPIGTRIARSSTVGTGDSHSPIECRDNLILQVEGDGGIATIDGVRTSVREDAIIGEDHSTRGELRIRNAGFRSSGVKDVICLVVGSARQFQCAQASQRSTGKDKGAAFIVIRGDVTHGNAANAQFLIGVLEQGVQRRVPDGV